MFRDIGCIPSSFSGKERHRESEYERQTERDTETDRQRTTMTDRQIERERAEE